ncbi:MAG: hypothetical protein L0H31_10330 [Nocardioidaceae bacterium]|nr:hypothetical protein [Nocardioidaceae bacterium]
MAIPELAIVDVETTGLDPSENNVLELGILLLDIDLNEIDAFSGVVSSPGAVAALDRLAMLSAQQPQHPGEEPYQGARIVHEMHQKSKLAYDIREAAGRGRPQTVAQVEADAVAFLESHNVKPSAHRLPMTGSSIHFDRRFLAERMPTLEAQFHYRNIDISSIKEVTKLYRSDVADRAAKELKPKALHRSLPDCRDSVGELRFYLENIFAKGAGK